MIPRRLCLAVVAGCAAAPHAVELDLRADADLTCHAYMTGEPGARVAVLSMGGTGLGSLAFVAPELRVPGLATISFDKPGVRAPFGDPAAVQVDDAIARRHTQGSLLACARHAIDAITTRFGPVPIILRGHSEGTLIALALYPEIAGRVRALVLSGLPLEPFDVLLRRQLATRPALAEAIARCDWPTMKKLTGVSCEYIADADKRPSGRALIEKLPATIEIDVLAGIDDELTPVRFIRDLAAWNATTGHLDLHIHEYAGGHQGSDEAHRFLAALIQRLAR